MTSVTIRGDKELLRKLRKLDTNQQKAAFTAIGEHVKGEMQVYPPQGFAGSSPGAGTYRRTQRLQDGWNYQAKRDKVRVFNRVSYAPWVQGEDTQFHFHAATGWKTLRGTVRKENDEIIRLVKRQVDRILRTG